MLDRILECLLDTMMALFMPLVCFYFTLTVDPFFNISMENATGLEKASNTLLAPAQYLLAGNRAALQPDGSWQLQQRFEYKQNFWGYSFLSAMALPPSLVVGGALKALSLCNEKTRDRFTSLKHSLQSSKCLSHSKLYREIGLPIGEIAQMTFTTGGNHQRRPGDENHLSAEKGALKEIATLLNRENIPWWIDCGTCLGAYRYGGVIPWDFDIDIAVLLPDFENVGRALSELDPQKYIVQNWSSRENPNSYLKVFIRETGKMIDIYHFAIDPVKRQLSYVLSLETHSFFPDWWKEEQQVYKRPVAFETVFPLKKMLFDGIEVLIPQDPEAYLQRYYGENLDPVKLYNPATCRYEKDLTHPYWQK